MNPLAPHLEGFAKQVALHQDLYSKYLFESRGPGSEAQQRYVQAQARLNWLVPMNRALRALAQQLPTGGLNGARNYYKRYRSLLASINTSLDAFRKHRADYYFGDSLLDLQLLVPVLGIPVTEWASITLAGLLEQETTKRQLYLTEIQRQAQAAEDARRAVLKSLSPEQLALLQSAIELAKVTGRHQVQYSLHDVQTFSAPRTSSLASC